MQNSIKACSTPLASIFGSGFLVIVPILAGAVGAYAPLAMAFVCFVAWCVGSTIRHNILHVEPLLADNTPRLVRALESASDAALVLAYMISVCLYLHVMSAFVMNGVGMDTPRNEDTLTTIVITLITVVALIRGLDFLERIETWALIITLAVVASLIISFALYDLNGYNAAELMLPDAPQRSAWEIATIVGGTLIVVQGFETTRYLGGQYSAATRITASRWSQYISSIVYIGFVALAVPTLHELGGQYNDHSLIDLTVATGAVLVAPLIVAAALSQFSAAVADTVAGAGNLFEVSKGRVTDRVAYLLIGAVAIALTWTAHTYQIISLASRAFALYYLLQTLVAISVSKSVARKAAFLILALVMAFITLFAVPA